ncbi:MAG: glycosyltransferase family 39 protein [Planctomycetota bacterium]
MSVTLPPATAARPDAAVDPAAAIAVSAAVAPFRPLHLWLLSAITLVAAALRLWHIGDWSIWVDEAHTWRDVTMPLDDFAASARGWYPTSYLLLRWLMEAGWLGQLTEGWLRLPFAFCGIVTVPLLALFGRRLVGRRAALLAALLLAINPWHIYWSQNARAYVLVGLFAVAAAGSFWIGVERRSRPWYLVGVALALVAGSCHAAGLLLLPVFVAYPLLASGRLEGRRPLVLVAAGGLTLLLLPLVLELFPPLRIFMMARQETAPSLLHLVQTTAFYFRVPLVCAGMAGLVLLAPPRLRGRALFLSLWALLPLLLLGVVGSMVVKVTARYALCALPALVLLAAVACVRLGEVLVAAHRAPGRWTRLLPALVLPGILAVDMLSYDYLYFRVQNGDRGRWREASAIVQHAAGDTPLLVATTHEPVLMYYLRPNNYRSAADMAIDPDDTLVVSIEPHHLYQMHEGERTDGFDYVKSLRDLAVVEGRALLFAAALPELREKDRDGTLRQALRRDCELIEVLPCWVGPKDESIYVWKLR